MVRTTEPVPPEPSAKLFELKVTVGDRLVLGDTLVDRLTVPAKPLRLVRVIVDDA